METDNRLVRFDWAIKRLLRHKADHTILEGFLTSLLGRPIKILRLLESESNKESEENKSNRVDMLAEEADGSKILIEVQNENEASYFHRMLFGTSRIISEYIKSGENYDKVTKVYSVNIVYFNLGEGADYIYKGKTEFRGIHNDDVLQLPKHLQVKYDVETISELFPEYFILKVNDFNKWSKTPLDQWMYFLSTSEIPQDADAPGLKEASEQLRVASLPIEEQNAYFSHLRDMNSWRNMVDDAYSEGKFEGKQEGIEIGKEQGIEIGKEQGRLEEKLKLAKNLLAMGMDMQLISKATGLSEEELSAK